MMNPPPSPKMVALTRDIFQQGKPLAAICHAGSMLIEAGVVRGRKVTSWPSVKTDLTNAGANWVDQELVEDANLITSRKPDDLPAFSEAILRQLQKAPRTQRSGNGATERARRV